LWSFGPGPALLAVPVLGLLSTVLLDAPLFFLDFLHLAPEVVVAVVAIAPLAGESSDSI